MIHPEPQASDVLFRSVAEASPLAIAVSEGEAHVLRYVNPAFCKLYGRQPQELLGHPFQEACCEEEASTARDLLDRVFRSGASESLADVRRPQPEGPAVFWSYAAWPLPDHAGVTTQISDTTARHLAAHAREGALQQANQQLLIAALREEERSESLEQADRAKDEFVAMLAHELRNPLAAIRTGIYLLEQRSSPEDTHTRETCALLMRQMRHLARLLDDLLDVSRITRGKLTLQLEPVDLVQTVRHAVAASQSQLELNQHALTLALPAEAVWVEGDAVRLEQVLTNLLQNAGKYMDPGGQVWVSLEVLPADGPTAPSASIRVRDCGVGMSADTLEHVFDLFVQGDPSKPHARSGLGIGLTLVHRLVLLHGGAVHAHSAGLGQGSEFQVVLPLRPGPRLHPFPEPPAPDRTELECRRVLLVEDNVAAAVTLAEVLELWGHEVVVAHSGAAALAAAGRRPDVVLLDIGLPDMEGYEVARLMRAGGLHTALLVALTGYGRDADRQRSRESGFDYHLVKPVDLDELRRTLAAACGNATAPAA